MDNLLKKRTTLLLTFCMIAGMTGLPITAYAEGLDSGGGGAYIAAVDKAAPEIGFSVTDSVYGATEFKEEGLSMLFSPMSVVEWVGNGDADSPYQVSSAEHLADIPNQGMGAHYIQTEDIDLTGINWTPIVLGFDAFTGTYNGNNKTIFNLAIDSDSTQHAGLFGAVGDGGTLENITLENVSIHISRNSSYVGGLVGINAGGTIKDNCVSGSITAIGSHARAGGLVGHNLNGTIEDSSASCIVTGGENVTNYIGGLVGYCYGGEISNCCSNGNAAGTFRVGGLIGYLTNSGTIEYCYSTVNVTGRLYDLGEIGDIGDIGGLAGSVENGIITKSCSTGNVSVESDPTSVYIAGGLVGFFLSGDIKDSYSTGNVILSNSNIPTHQGGFIGYLSSSVTLENCYSTGNVVNEDPSGGGIIGGFIGYKSINNTTITSCYFLDTGVTSPAGGTALDATQLKQKDSYSNWDFNNIWKIGENISYPTLQWQPWTTDERITADYNALVWDNIKGANSAENNITSALSLISSGARGTAIAWSADPVGYINTSDGTLTRPYTDEVIVTLTASVSKDSGTTQTKSFSLTVKPWTPDEAITLDKAALTWAVIRGTNSTEDHVTADLELSDTGASGTTAITWDAVPVGYIDVSNGKVTMPDDGNKTVTLTATVTRDGGTPQTVDFTLTIIAYYPVTFTAGTGGSITNGTSGSYEAGTVIEISAAPGSGYQFNKWITGNGGSFANAASASTTFTVPANATIVTATFSRSGSDDRDEPPKSAEPGYKAEVKTGDGEKAALIVTVDKSGGTASVDAGSQSIDRGGAVITIPTVPDVDAYSVNIPVTSLSTADAQGTLTVNTERGSITLPSNMLTGIPGISGSKAQISIAQGDKNALPDAVKAAVGDRPLIQLTLSIDGKQTDWSNPDTSVTVSIPYTPTEEELANHESIVVWYIDGSGNVVSVPNGRYDPASGKVIFNITHFSHYAIVYVHKAFSDLGSAEWARKPVEIMASKGIINGTGKDTFSPAASITRADYLVLLVKTLELAAGFDNNFDDVDKSAYYYDAIGIARKLGITAGSGNNRFNPRESISRQDMMVMTARALERFKGLKVSDTNGVLDKFADKEDMAEYAVSSMSALVAEGLIAGTGNKLNPCEYTTRAEAAVFLYNIYSKYQ